MASTFRFVWDGNVLLHETFKKDNSENTELTTWVFEGFVPTAKLVNGKAYSIISDHLGTPILAIDSEGNEVWNRQLDIYGRVKREIKASSLGDDVRPFIPFLYQGQYYDVETKLAYNRYRYYSPETGAYISQDPIRLNGNNPNIYAYVGNNNLWVDVFGLKLLLPEAPTYSGVYHIVGDDGKKYVGSAVNIRDRLESNAHPKAAEIINTGNYTITFHEVSLGDIDATDKTNKRVVNHVLRYHEDDIFDKQKYTPQKDGVQNANKPMADNKQTQYEEEVKKHNVHFTGKKDSKTCKKQS